MSEPTDLPVEIAHILFIDIVGYSKLLMNEQSEVLQQLNDVVRRTEQFRAAETTGKLIRIPVGDGMALVFYNGPEAPVRGAVEISQALRDYPQIRLRMGIHSGPVNKVLDVNERSNVAGAGINTAQRVMDCGDAGHILLSKRVADDLAPFGHWRSQLHELGEVESKHGETVFLVNFYNDKVGNRQLPQRLKRTRQEAIGSALGQPAPTVAKARRVPLMAILIGGVALILGGLFLLSRIGPKTVRNLASPNPEIVTSIPEKSIAVLPFENLSTDQENAFFAGGVQDEILTDLAKIADLKVISRTSVMKYKSGPERSLRDIARALGVAHVVEGSVQRSGGMIRVHAQLIDARTDAHIWAEHYDRDIADVFAIQSEIAQKIAEQLRTKLSPQEKAGIAERPTADLSAYALYSQARAIEVWADRPEKNLARKIQLLQQAVEHDPKFVLAWCELSKLQADLAMFEDADNHLAAARRAAETALKLRPDLGQPHLALAYYYESNRAERERAYGELSIARRTLPNDALLFRILSQLDKRRNRWDDALAESRKAYELDPLNEETAYHLSDTYRSMRLYPEREKLEQGVEASNGIAWSSLAIAENRLDTGDPAAAQSFLSKIPIDFSPTDEIWFTRFSAAVYQRDYDAADQVLAAIPPEMAEQMFDAKPPDSSADAFLARARGDQQKAQALYSAIREKVSAKWAGPPQKYFEIAKAARLDAGSGKKQEAINEALRAVELCPIAQDSLFGPDVVRTLALVYAWTGEPGLAIEQLEIIAKVPAGPSYGELKFDPTWDSLRRDPRFEKIVASLEPK